MPTHAEARFFPYTQQQLFDLVADVEAYPLFLPWCKEALVHRKTSEDMEADLVIGFGFLKESFSSHVQFSPLERIEVRYTKGPFRHLQTCWRFIPDLERGGCVVDFFIDFEFQHPLFRHMMEVVFEEAVRRMMGAFEKRAKALFQP
ncbi:MAG: type II toxin-antitoxin system RatA family toxin [Alphaproteobacteria bacterium]